MKLLSAEEDLGQALATTNSTTSPAACRWAHPTTTMPPRLTPLPSACSGTNQGGQTTGTLDCSAAGDTGMNPMAGSEWYALLASPPGLETCVALAVLIT